MIRLNEYLDLNTEINGIMCVFFMSATKTKAIQKQLRATSSNKTNKW